MNLDLFGSIESSFRAHFVDTPAARSSDPETSHEAEEYINATGNRAEQQARTIAAVRAFPGLTMQELAQATGYCRFMLGRRISECETAGAVVRGQKRKCAVTGRTAEPWYPVDPNARKAA